MILVEIHDLRAPPLRFQQIGMMSCLERLHEIDRALPVAVIELSRADQWIQTRRIEAIGELFGHDLDVVAKYLGKMGNARRPRQCPQDLGFAWRLIAREARGHYNVGSRGWCRRLRYIAQAAVLTQVTGRP